MGKYKKTDNTYMRHKLDIRRYFLKKYHEGNKPHVFDCCQGSGCLWTQLCQEYEIGNYWGVDLKPKKGRLKVDSIKIVSQKGLDADIIDIDTYGLPWKHFLGLIPNIEKPTTIFLTIGQVKIMGGNMGKIAMETLGLPNKTPQSLAVKFFDKSIVYCCNIVAKYDIILIEVVEAVSDGNAKYYGLRLEPKRR
jgi:hypothetical protein